MLATLMATVLLVAQAPSQPARCSGVDPELFAFSVKSVTRTGKYDRYTVTVDVKNAGASAEPTNFPQDVDVFQDGHPVATIPVPQLKAGQGWTVTAVIEVPQATRHPNFVARLVDSEARLPAPKRCRTLHDRLEIHV